MRVLVVGAGATGGYFGARLAQAGRDISFLVRPARAAQLRQDGLRILSPHGDATLAPKLLTAPDLHQVFDVAIVAVKAFALNQALADAAAAIGPETMILPLLNGMRHFETIVARFTRQNVLGSLCKVMTTVDAEGRIVQLGKPQQMIYGELDGGLSPRVEALHAVLSGAGFDAQATPDIQAALWEKWVFLASLGAITCLARGPVGAIAAVPGGDAMIAGILAEIAAIATANKHPPGSATMKALHTQLTQRDSSQTSSMYRDLQQGHAVEAEQILGDLADRARQAGLHTPLLNAALVQLRVYSAARAA